MCGPTFRALSHLSKAIPIDMCVATCNAVMRYFSAITEHLVLW